MIFFWWKYKLFHFGLQPFPQAKGILFVSQLILSLEPSRVDCPLSERTHTCYVETVKI